jgi:uncharacterized RDD family membrane protein YckC
VAEPSGPRAGFGTRFVAALIDGIILAIASLVLSVVIGSTGGRGLGTLLTIAYFAWFEGTTGQTIGKRMMNIKVVKVTGDDMTIGDGVVRSVVRVISGFVCGLGFFWALWDPERQTWHDKAASTYVVPAL